MLFLEHKHLYRQRYAADPVPPAGWMVPFGRGTVARPGRDLTIVTWGATVQKSSWPRPSSKTNARSR